MKALTKLKRKLLSLGGTGFQKENYLKGEISEELCTELVEHGFVMNRRGLKMKRMTLSQCGANAFGLVFLNPEHHVCVGFGLNEDDGIWRYHAWVMDGTDGVLIETTVKRDKYYGIVTAVGGSQE